MSVNFTKEPDFVNEKGVKWWCDYETTKYAMVENAQGNTLPGVVVYAVEEPNGHRTYLICDKKGVLFESQRLEDIGVHLDMMKIVKSYD